METLAKLRKEFVHWNYLAYYYQKHNYHASKDKAGYEGLLGSFMSGCSQVEEALNKSLWKMELAPVGDAKPYRFQDLKDMTRDFLEYSIYETSRGRLFVYHDGNVAIKTWDFLVPQQHHYVDNQSSFCNELEILTGENLHPCLIKIKGFCFQHILAVVYDEMPTKFLKHKLRSGKRFKWDDRMRVATQLASLFTWFHERRFSFGSIKPEGIMIDEKFNIKVFDFGFLARVREEDNGVPMCYPVFPDAPEAGHGIRTLKADVYVFGGLLVELIGNNVEEDDMPLHDWALEQLQGGKRSIVDKSLLQDNDELAISITDMAVECLSKDPNARPDMKEVSAKLSILVEATPN